MFRKMNEIWKSFDTEVLSKDPHEEGRSKFGKVNHGDKTFDFKGQR